MNESFDLTGLIATGAALAEVRRPDETGIPFIMRPRGGGAADVESLEKLQLHPARTRAVVKVRDSESFIRYVEDHRKGDDVVRIFAEVTETSAKFLAVLDYHGESPAWGEHRVLFECTHSPEWRRWIASNGKKMSQREFATFIEDNELDIVQPDAATMKEIALTLEAKTTVDFASGTRLQNGTQSLKYVETTEAKAGKQGEVEIPESIVLALSPFLGFPTFRVPARLRYKIESGNLSLWYEVVRPHKVIEACGDDVVAVITSGTKVQPLLGDLVSMGL